MVPSVDLYFNAGPAPTTRGHLGHASIRTTSDRYGHLYAAARDRLRDHLDQTFTDAAGTESASA